MVEQLSYLPPEPVKFVVTMRTYIYIREEDDKCVHSNAGGGFIGQEYEHDDPNWQPSEDWPYEIIDLRKEKTQNERG